MGSTQVFPFDTVKKGTGIVIYGAGDLGQKYYNQIKQTNWCEIRAIVDRNYESIINCPFDVRNPGDIPGIGNYDSIVLALASEVYKKEAIDYLMGIGVSEDKIISGSDARYFRDNGESIVFLEGDDGDDIIKIAFSISKAMGDQVISLKVYQELERIADNILFDVYCGKSQTAESVYYGQDHLNRIVKSYPCKDEYDNYDLVLQVDYCMTVFAVREKKIKRNSIHLFRTVKKMIDYQRTFSPDTSEYEYNCRIMIDRGKLLGENRYELLGNEGALQINDTKVRINVDETYKSELSDLSIPKPYITINYGSGNAMGDGREQTKNWPIEYYHSLVAMLKERFPALYIVQLGTKRAKCIEGVDCYLFDKPLDLVKLVLLGSTLHIDCESGLPHLATQLGVKCAVLFGPTPVGFVGYKENINIESEVCCGCEGMVKDWYVRCLRYEEPVCMKSIKPEKVFGKVEDYLEAAL